ncbi:antitoxin [Nigerium massiliense]|uniref:antitoxin n=1 Tax=Nigerium massiliense TaxID=1522317 RepID=UPI00058D46AE|nr:antitoxin [Nigerium massiliense]
MGIFDKAKDMSQGHEAETDAALQQGADRVNQATGGKYADQVEKGRAAADAQVGDEAGNQMPPQ